MCQAQNLTQSLLSQQNLCDAEGKKNGCQKEGNWKEVQGCNRCECTSSRWVGEYNTSTTHTFQVDVVKLFVINQSIVSWMSSVRLLHIQKTTGSHMNTKPDQSQFTASLFLPGASGFLSLALATQALHLISAITVCVWVRWVSHLSQWPVMSQPGWRDASLCAAGCWLIRVSGCRRSLTYFHVLLNAVGFYSCLWLEQQWQSRMLAEDDSRRLQTSG